MVAAVGEHAAEGERRDFMGWKFAAISRYRPRVLTLVVLFAVAAPVALANRTFDERSNGHILHRSFGWPLIWHRYLSIGW